MIKSDEFGQLNQRITGTLLSYYFICHRKLWLHAHGLNMENISGNADVIKGKIMHENRFQRENNREIDFDNIKIDFLKFKDQVFVHEVKKSKRFEEAHNWQLKYYIYNLQKRGINCNSGIIHYPASMKRVDVIFTEEDEKLIKKSLEEINKILDKIHPPVKLNKKFCKKCAYFDFCYA